MFYKKHPIATAIVLSILLPGLLLIAVILAAAFAFVAMIYSVFYEPGALALDIVLLGVFFAGFVAFLKPLIPMSSRWR